MVPVNPADVLPPVLTKEKKNEESPGQNTTKPNENNITRLIAEIQKLEAAITASSKPKKPQQYIFVRRIGPQPLYSIKNISAQNTEAQNSVFHKTDPLLSSTSLLGTPGLTSTCTNANAVVTTTSSLGASLTTSSQVSTASSNYEPWNDGCHGYSTPS